ncbi:Aquaporin-3, partial [Tyrophagus putrescentiae]
MAKNGVQKSRRPKQWVREMLAELVGTYLLIMIGDSAVANYVLNRKSTGDHFAIAFTFGVAGMMGIAASFPISALRRFTGAGNASTYARLATGGVFSTYPAEHVSIAGTLVDQIVATFSLVLGALIITSPHAKLPNYLHPFMLGMMICGLVVGFGLNCGAALNPARDLSPRLFQLLAGYGLNAFKPIKWTYWLTAGIIGPHVGGILGAWIFDWVLFYGDDDDSCKGRSSPDKGSKGASGSGSRSG